MIIASLSSDMLKKNGCSLFENLYRLRDWEIVSTIIIIKKAQAMPGSPLFFRSTPFTNLTQLGPILIPAVGGGLRVSAIHNVVTLETEGSGIKWRGLLESEAGLLWAVVGFRT